MKPFDDPCMPGRDGGIEPDAIPLDSVKHWSAPRALAAASLLLMLLMVSARPTPAPEASPNASADLHEKYEKVAGEVICYCGCTRQTVKDCTCGVAFDLRQQFEARLTAGETPESIIASYLSEHGEQARNVPPKKGLNLLAWFGPGIGILVAGVVTLVVLAIWARRGRQPVLQSPEQPSPPISDPQIRERLERELEEFEI